MKITIRTPQMQDYDRFSAIMDQVFKGMCRPDESPEQKVARPHMHEGPKFKIQYSSLVLSQATTWFRTEVLLYLSGL